MILKLDFTLKALIELYQALERNNYKIIRFSDFFEGSNETKICILRHDIDRDIRGSLKLAKLENKMSIKASYFFRYKKTFIKEIIQEIHSLGHEVGYHYETLAKTKGDYHEAFELFKKELEELRRVAPVNTISAHGSPFSQWDNKKLWNKYNFKDSDIKGEAYLSLNFNEFFYLTDTGRGWNKTTGNIRDRVNTRFNYTFSNIFEVVTALNKGELPDKIMLNIHPNRWADNLFKWLIELINQNIKNLVKKALIKK